MFIASSSVISMAGLVSGSGSGSGVQAGRQSAVVAVNNANNRFIEFFFKKETAQSGGLK